MDNFVSHSGVPINNLAPMRNCPGVQDKLKWMPGYYFEAVKVEKICFVQYLQVTRTCINAWLSSNFVQLPPLTTTELAVSKIVVPTFFLVATDPFHFKLADNKEMHHYYLG